MDVLTAQLFRNMTAYDAGDPARIQHFTKVYAYADLIGTSEGLTEEELRVLRAAAILHDIGIHKSEEKYGDDNGKHQELEGPPEAGKLLSRVEGYTEDEKRRILYLIGHHHSYTEIDGSDYQILVEADFLVNLFENHPQSIDKAAAAAALSRIFRTKSGKEMLEMMFLREEYKKPGNEWKSAADTVQERTDPLACGAVRCTGACRGGTGMFSRGGSRDRGRDRRARPQLRRSLFCTKRALCGADQTDFLCGRFCHR